jgi:two-component system LytT family response regulator
VVAVSLLFDIELEDGVSVEKLKSFDNIDFQIIFITSYKKYAIDAIKVSAVDYLLKPIDPQELKSAVDKALKRLNSEKEHLTLKELEKQQEESRKRIVIKTSDNTYYLYPEDIIVLEAEGAYTSVVTSERRILTSRNLRHYESLFEPYNFARSHQKYLVNLDHVKSVDSNYDIILTNGHKAKISTRRRSEILKKLNL